MGDLVAGYVLAQIHCLQRAQGKDREALFNTLLSRVTLALQMAMINSCPLREQSLLLDIV